MLFLIFSFHESQEGHLLIFCFICFICLEYVLVVCFGDVVTGKGTIYTVRCKLVLAAGSSTGGCSDQALLLGALLWEFLRAFLRNGARFPPKESKLSFNLCPAPCSGMWILTCMC